MATAKNDKDFIRDYSKAIATALLEKEQHSQSSPHHHHDHEGTIETTYRALCFDEPRVESDEHLFLLAKELMKGHSSPASWVALSDRLVEGIRQGSARYSHRATPPTTTDTAIDTTTTMLLQNTDSNSAATASGFATCAVAAFVHIPLQCCLASSKINVEQWLGSYRGQPQQQHEKSTMEEQMSNLQLENMQEAIQKSELNTNIPIEDDTSSAELHHEDLQHQHLQQQNEDDEVWADESDPSDFVYESEAIDWTEWDDPTLDPKQVSQPIPGAWDELRHAVRNLLHELSYDKLAPLSISQWNTFKVSDLLTQLTLTLLLHQDNSHVMADESIRTLGTQPLHVFQDGILSGRNDMLPDYLSLIQSLIAVHATSTATTKDTHTHTTTLLSPASIIGLVSLSKFSGHAKSIKETRRIRRYILECSEDIGLLISKTNYSDHRITWAILPLLDVIANRNMDATILEPSLEGLSTADAQWLLNSGFFRELIMLYCWSHETTTTPADELLRKSLLQSIQLLCLENMTLLGKYAWRVPEFSTALYTIRSQQTNNPDAIVWNLMGIQLTNNSATATFRTKSTVQPVVTVDSCREMYQQGFEQLRNNVVSSIHTISTLRETIQTNIEPLTETTWKDSILNLVRFTNLLQSCSSLTGIWKSEQSSDTLVSWLIPIRSALSTVPSVVLAKEMTASLTTKTADNDKAGVPTEHQSSTYEDDLAMIRKSIKVLTLSLQADSAMGSLSSKTD